MKSKIPEVELAPPLMEDDYSGHDLVCELSRAEYFSVEGVVAERASRQARTEWVKGKLLDLQSRIVCSKMDRNEETCFERVMDYVNFCSNCNVIREILELVSL